MIPMHQITHSNFSSEAAVVIPVSRDFRHTLRVDIEADFLNIEYRRFLPYFSFFRHITLLLCSSLHYCG